jgi:hypothetical protein
MIVFISWSGELSRATARALHDWLPKVIQSINPYMSSEDIPHGAVWFRHIAQRLDEARFGIICVTKANVDSRWINFEAGALFKGVDSDVQRVSPFLVDLKPSELGDPLASFQATEPNLDSVTKLVKSLNTTGDLRLRDDIMMDAITQWWPHLEQQLRAAREAIIPSQPELPRDTHDMVEELLEVSRGIQRSILEPAPRVKGTVNVTSSEHEERRKERISLRIEEILSNANITPYEVRPVHGNTAEVRVRVGTQIPDNVMAELDRLNGGGLSINIMRDL